MWRPRQESNPQPTDPKSGALSIELLGRVRDYTRFAQLERQKVTHDLALRQGLKTLLQCFLLTWCA